ncbi:hypothetical protein X726_32690 [Mesorhizobium sp. L103C105A0]|nr:hypothetical protein X726_32690 [Mesorhizobium sp. L103C105A0]
MYDISLDSARLEPARQPKAVASSLIGDNDAPDFAPGLDGFAAPAAQQLKHRKSGSASSFLRGLRSKPGTVAAMSHFV